MSRRVGLRTMQSVGGRLIVPKLLGAGSTPCMHAKYPSGGVAATVFAELSGEEG